MTFCKTVWLIDDEEVSNHLTAAALQINGFASEIRSFTNGKEALAALETSEKDGLLPDYLFLDLNMPVLDGWEFLHTYRRFSEEVKKECTLYILSSSIDEEDAKKAKIHEDVRDFIAKPLNKNKLEMVKFQNKEVS
ncbi:response regulator [Nafulsella turpanensis]|uniref:response regulator n=1 Tax=Nafulsella turpanensis TaxID=1265690 RepID=UPI000348EA51|nr:response regulator [Nafulsella turpanensis]